MLQYIRTFVLRAVNELRDKLIAVDLFSGAGGLSTGFLQTGKVKIIAAVENNKWAQQTYDKNHQHLNIKMFDDINDLVEDEFREILNLVRISGHEKVDIVFGGPPCQGFSNANRQRSEVVSTNNQLVKAFVKAIEKLNPDAFLMENVKTLKSEKHKFYVSGNDRIGDLERLKLTPERLLVGQTPWVDMIKYAFKNPIFFDELLFQDEKVMAKVSHTLRKEKEFEFFLTKNKGIILHYINLNCDKIQNVCSEQDSFMTYRDCWNGVRNKTIAFFNNEIVDFDELFRDLKLVYEAQKILIKLHELKQKKIEVIDLTIDEDKVYVILRSYSVLDYLLAKFDELGYKLNGDDRILNAADYGAPQNRERLFILGIKKGLATDRVVELPEPFVGEKYTVYEAISDIESLTPVTEIQGDNKTLKIKMTPENPLQRYLHAGEKHLYNHVMTDTTSIAKKRFSMLGEGDNFHKLDESLKMTYTNPNRTQNTVYLRLKYDTPAGTVLNVRKSMWIHPKEDRAISIREAARLQTFPDNFRFFGTKDAQYQQIGNAVPPVLGRAVAEKMLEYLGIQPQEKLADIIGRPSKSEKVYQETLTFA